MESNILVKLKLFEINTNKNQKEAAKTNKKIMIVFGTNPNNINGIRKKLNDFSKKSGYQCNEIIPPFSLFSYKNDQKNEIISFYAENINKIQSNPKMINFIYIYTIIFFLSIIY